MTYQAIPEQTPIVAEFSTAQAALEYRKQHGGWVFVRDDASNAIWFDATQFTPTPIFLHPMTRGHGGKLL